MPNKKQFKIESVNIEDIKPADYNPRKMEDDEFQKLKESINEFGLVDPIIINLDNNKIIGGHQRYDVLYKTYQDNNDEYTGELFLIRLGKIGWVFNNTDLNIKDENHEKALNIALNKISGEWDNNKLSELIGDLNLTGFNINLTGFDDTEILSLELEQSGLNDFEEIDTEEPTEKEECDNNNDENTTFMDDSLNYTLKFNTENQENNFLKFIEKLKDEDKNKKTISQLLIQYLNDNNTYINTEEGEHITYNIIFDNLNDKNTFLDMIQILNNKYNMNNPLLSLINDIN